VISAVLLRDRALAELPRERVGSARCGRRSRGAARGGFPAFLRPLFYGREVRDRERTAQAAPALVTPALLPPLLVAKRPEGHGCSHFLAVTYRYSLYL